jgi:hypothetical protein
MRRRSELGSGCEKDLLAWLLNADFLRNHQRTDSIPKAEQLHFAALLSAAAVRHDTYPRPCLNEGVYHRSQKLASLRTLDEVVIPVGSKARCPWARNPRVVGREIKGAGIVVTVLIDSSDFSRHGREIDRSELRVEVPDELMRVCSKGRCAVCERVVQVKENVLRRTSAHDFHLTYHGFYCDRPR